ncbi:MAG: protein-L-isoaspartate(D-aspartate) O-methyltransferase [Chloroflexi bacterium]|nr:protein-L-isoaspartate(D-aspartate) O-methyltransferase [Chloroflexota bacterium]
MGRWHFLYQNPETAGFSGNGLTAEPLVRQDALETPAARLFANLRQDVNDDRVIQAMERIPRELFVPARIRHRAYEDEALPIGGEQTISQPYIVAMMTSALELEGDERVLEVGAGSGYQAAVLSCLAREVVSVERRPALAAGARRVLASLGITNVAVFEADNVLGWPSGAPYDAIIVTAAAPRIPQALVGQLREGGRLVIPVGSRAEQHLVQATKHGEQLAIKRMGGCRFVPLVGPDAWSE